MVQYNSRKAVSVPYCFWHQTTLPCQLSQIQKAKPQKPSSMYMVTRSLCIPPKLWVPKTPMPSSVMTLIYRVTQPMP